MKFFLFSTFFVLNTFLVLAQKLSIEGFVFDENQEPLVGATIAINEIELVTVTDSKGYFVFNNLVVSTYSLECTFIGYKKQLQEYNSQTNSKIIFNLQPKLEQLEEIVIHDHYLNHKKKEEALSIEIVNDDFIDKYKTGNLMNSLKRLPGVSSIDIGSGNAKPVIRGLSFQRVVVVENGIVHDGQQWGADHGLEIDQNAIEWIEIVKGPASLLYGSNAIGGVLDIKPTKFPAENSFGGNVSVSFMSNNMSLGSSVNLYGRKKKFFFNSRISYTDYADYKVPTDSVNIYSYKVGLDEGKLRNTAGDELGLHLSGGYINGILKSVVYVSYITSKSGFFANAHGREPRLVINSVYDNDNRDIMNPYQNVDHVKIINRTTSYREHSKTEIELGFQHNYRTEYSDYTPHGFMDEVVPAEVASENLEREFDKIILTANIKNYHDFNTHQFTYGLNAEHQENTIGGWSFIIPAYNQISTGIFVYDKIQLNDRLLIHSGIRYDYGIIDIQEEYDWFESIVIVGTDTSYEYLQRAQEIEKSYNNFSFALGINYNLEHFSFKSNIGKSFRMPIAKELAANGVNYHHFSFEKGNTELDSETSYQFDIGLEWNYPKWAFQISPFVNYFPNYIFLNPTEGFDYSYGAGNQIFEYIQNEVFRFGGEFHSHLKISDKIKLGAIGEYIYAEQLSGAKKGFGLPFSPPATLLLNLSYHPKIKKVLKEPSVSIDYKITSKQDRRVPPEEITEGYQLVNLVFGTKIKVYKQTINLDFQVKNILNKKYLNHTSFYRLIELPEPGRNLIISLNTNF